MHKLDQVVSEHHLLKHPFYQRWMEGMLSKDELKRYVVSYFPHVAAFPTYVSAVHSQSDDSKLRQELLANLIEEEHGPENHPELWLRFGEELGLDREKIQNGDPITEGFELVDTFRRLSRKSVASGLGALYAYESQVPTIAEQKISGLKQHYGIESERGLKFFAVHQEADQWHSATGREAIDGLSEPEQKEALDAAGEASRALWSFLSGLDRAAGVEEGCGSMNA